MGRGDAAPVGTGSESHRCWCRAHLETAGDEPCQPTGLDWESTGVALEGGEDSTGSQHMS